MNTDSLHIAERFCGPPGSGNGGYVCGLLARGLAGTVTARLKAPPPLGTPLRREWTPEAARLFDGPALIGEARSTELRLEAPDAPTPAQAGQAARDYSGFRSHPFPHCFVCGPARAPGDGLRIFPGPLHGRSLLAAPWVPDASLSDDGQHVNPEFAWAALDCPGGFAVMPLPEGLAVVLGELTASIGRPLTVGQPVIVTAWPIGQEGRRRMAGSAIHTADGERIAVARAVWIEVPLRQWAPGGEPAS